MHKTKNYIRIIFMLIVTLLQSCSRVAKQFVLPSHKKKGNLISSLLLLFIDFTEHITGCRQSLLVYPIPIKWKIPAQQRLENIWGLSKKRLRYITFLTAWVLFILSLPEWAHPSRQFYYSDNSRTTDVSYYDSTNTKCVEPYNSYIDRQQIEYSRRLYVAAFHPIKASNKLNCFVASSSTTKRWLLLCSLRI